MISRTAFAVAAMISIPLALVLGSMISAPRPRVGENIILLSADNWHCTAQSTFFSTGDTLRPFPICNRYERRTP